MMSRTIAYMYISNKIFTTKLKISYSKTGANPLYKPFTMYQVRVTVAMQQVSICTYGYNQSSCLVPQL